MTQMLVSPNFGWIHLVMSAKDFITFSEIIERSTLVDSRYLGEETIWVDRNDTKQTIQAEMFKKTICTTAQYEEMKKEYQNG